jgi:hypothetical protein
MSVERKLLLVKLLGFLTGEISKTEIYEWALFVAVSRDYEELIKNDKLSEYIIQFMIDVDKPRTTTTPTKKIVEYFIACLEDKKQFSEEDYKVLIADQPPAKPGAGTKAVPAEAKQNLQISVKPPSENAENAKKESVKESWFALVARIYVFIFIGISLALNLTVIFKPDFLMQPGEIAPLPDNVLRDAFPHLFYGLTMIIALIVRGPKILFYPLFFIAAWGMFFYWYSITMFVSEKQWPLYYLVILSPILTLPPTMMFWIMLSRWFNITRPASTN